MPTPGTPERCARGANAIRALNALSAHVWSALTYPHEPTPCANAAHTMASRNAANIIEQMITCGVTDAVRYVAAVTPDGTNAIRTKRLRTLAETMARNWREGQPS